MKKKTYIKPCIEAVQVEMQQMLAASDNDYIEGVDGTYNFGTSYDDDDEQTTDEVW